MKNKFSIGEMAKLHNISVQTLRYYDKIGLFKPNYIDEANGYRYYTVQQFDRLDTIKYMKFLGLPLREIRVSLDSYEVANARQLLLRQKKAVGKKIEQLNLIRKRLDDKLGSLNAGMSINDLEQIGVKSIGERNCALLEFDRPANNYDMLLSGRELDDTLMSNMAGFFTLFCIILPQENLLNGKFHLFKAIGFIGDDSDFKPESLKTIRAGKYAYTYHQGPYEKTDVSYNNLLRFIESNSYTIAGNAIEICLIDQSLTSKEEEFITEIQIPVKKD